MDQIDRRLLVLLQESGRIPQNELAHAVGLSAPAVAERIRKLEERGVIQRYTTIVDPRSIGLDVTAFVAVTISGSRYYAPFAQRVEERGEILECHSITGQGSHLLKVRVANTTVLEALLGEIQSWPGVQSTMTSVVLSTSKEVVTPPVGDPDLAAEPTSRDEVGPTSWLHVPFRHRT